MLVVADTSPLLYLGQLGLLDILPALFDTVLIRRAVWVELVQNQPDAPGVAHVRAAAWLRVSLRVDLVDPTLDLDAGETDRSLVTELRPILQALERAGFRIAPAIIQAVLRDADENPVDC